VARSEQVTALISTYLSKVMDDLRAARRIGQVADGDADNRCLMDIKVTTSASGAAAGRRWRPASGAPGGFGIITGQQPDCHFLYSEHFATSSTIAVEESMPV
jgi:hypothetical protein